MTQIPLAELHVLRRAAEPALADPQSSALARLVGPGVAELAPAGIAPFAMRRIGENAPLLHQGAQARHAYLVQAGYFKIVRIGEDGYEQVLDFVARDELLGADALADGRYTSGAVALEESWVWALELDAVQRLVRRVPGFASHWQALLARQIARAGELAWMMAAVGADKRTARFVILYSRRMAERGQSPRRLLLHMGRRDIACHLGLAPESISRAFSLLADSGILRVDNREIEILDAGALHHYALTTRGYPEHATGRRLAAAA
jgi:CRP/FNR family transcriptional regulator